MTDDGGGLLWKNQSWANFLNSDNSGAGAGGVDEKSGKKLLDSSTSNNQTPSENETAVVAGGKKGSSSDLEGNKKNNKNGKGIIINEGKGGTGGGGSDQSSDHEIHIWTERERRKKMRFMFSNLHALLPQLPPKADKSTIVDEAVNYIKTLQHTLQKLQKQKLERLHGVATVNYGGLPSLVTPPKLAMDTREAFLADQISSNTNSIPITSTNSSISSPHFPPIFQSWNSKNLILNVCGLDAQFCVCSPKKLGLLTGICFVLEKYKLEVVSAQVSSDNCKSMYMIHTHACCLDFLEVVPVEEIYKQAAGEIIFFINSK